MRRDVTLLLAFVVAVLLMSLSLPSRGEQLYLIGESDTHRHLIDVHTIELSDPDAADPFIHVRTAEVLLSTGAVRVGLATTSVSACDNEGGRGVYSTKGIDRRTSVVWSKQGNRIYDHLFRHTCEWLLVILKEKPDQLFKPSAPSNNRRSIPGA